MGWFRHWTDCPNKAHNRLLATSVIGSFTSIRSDKFKRNAYLARIYANNSFLSLNLQLSAVESIIYIHI